MGMGRHRHKNRASAPILWDQLILCQLLLHAFNICAWLINLVDGYNDLYLCRLGMADGLYGLRHHAIVCSHHKNGDICGVRPAHTHCCKRFMPWRIKEGDLLSIAFYHVSADMLGDAACLLVNHMGIADGIQQGSLPVVYMAHYTDNRRAFYLRGFIFFRFLQQLCNNVYLLFLFTDAIKLQCNLFGRGKINLTVHG